MYLFDLPSCWPDVSSRPLAQVLTVNMVTAVTLGLVLALETPEPGSMLRPPRR